VPSAFPFRDDFPNPVPPVGLEPTRSALLGSLPLPLGYEGGRHDRRPLRLWNCMPKECPSLTNSQVRVGSGNQPLTAEYRVSGHCRLTRMTIAVAADRIYLVYSDTAAFTGQRGSGEIEQPDSRPPG
jgi:hypothetical protein